MTPDLDTFAAVFLTWCATYLVHSTLLLAGAWLFVRWAKPQSHLLRERVWKLAAVAGLFTSALPLHRGNAWTLDLSRTEPVEVAVNEPSEPPPADVSLNSAVEPTVEPVSTDAPEPTADRPVVSDAAPVFDVAPLVGMPADREPLPEHVDGVDAFAPVEAIESSADSAAPVVPGPVVEEAIPVETPVVVTEEPADAIFPVEADPMVEPVEEAVERLPVVAEPLVSSPMRWRTRIGVVLMVLMGSAVVLVQAQTCRLARRLARLAPLAAGPARTMLDELLVRSRVGRRVRLLASENRAEPIACGVWRWTIVLPAGIEERLAADELRALLAHELAHLVRGDTWWLWLGRVLCSACAFQPLNFVARREWRESAEFACDAWAVEQRVSAFALARCLTHVAEWKQSGAAPSVGLAASGTETSLSRRVERLVAGRIEFDPWSRRTRRRAWRVGTAIAIVALSIWGPRAIVPALSLAEAASIDDGASNTSEPPLGDARDESALLDGELAELRTELAELETQLAAKSEVRLESTVDQLRKRTTSLSAAHDRWKHILGTDTQSNSTKNR